MYHSGEAQTDLTVPCSQIGNGSSPKIPNPYARGPPYASLNIHKPVSLWQAPSDKDSSLKTSTMSQKGCSDLALRGQICILQIVDSWRVLKDFRTTLKTLYVAQIISKRLGSKDFWRVVKKIWVEVSWCEGGTRPARQIHTDGASMAYFLFLSFGRFIPVELLLPLCHLSLSELN